MKKVHVVKALSLLCILALPGAATADPVIVEVENQGDALVFYPATEFSQLILTVTGPCDYQYRQVVEEGKLYFPLDGTTIDGIYTFNVRREEPVDPGIIKVLLEARQNFDEETPKQLCRDGKLPAAPIAQSASFRVFRGKIIYDPGAFEKDLSFGDSDVPATTKANASFASQTELGFAYKDFVINDDLIVDGSACIGFDCVNGESFGFDTIRLKENNLRIKFDDTSVAASFPRNDWQLTANDSANGGASKFSIDDIGGNRTPFTVEANARSHSLYVDDGGRIGSRTSTPSVEIHTIDGDTPTLRLQQDGSSGFAPQTWDVAGNETNFFIRDVTNGSTLPFRIRPQAPTSSIFIDVDGNVGMGTSSPDEELDIQGAAADTVAIELTNDTSWRIRNQGSNGWLELRNESTATTIPMRIADGAVSNLLLVGASDASTPVSDQVTVTGNLVITGTCSAGGGACDGVFGPDYALPSIEEHAAFMWENSYLPGVGPTPDDKTTINVFEKTTGILNELEKAHIYIEQLQQRLARLEARLEEQAAE